MQRSFLRVLCPLAFSFLGFSSPALGAGDSLNGRLAEMGARFEAQPELKSVPGSGWKPYNRAKWFYEQRAEGGVEPSAAALWAAWGERQLRAAQTNARTSWFSLGPVTLSGRILDIEFHPTDPAILYVCSASGGLWKSQDGGESYFTTTDQLPVLGTGAVLVLPWSPQVVLLGTGEGNGTSVFGVGILKSTDAGATWSPTGLSFDLAQNVGFNCMEANPLTGTILAAANAGLWRSTDEGDSWTQIASGPWYDVKWKPGDAARVYATYAMSGQFSGVKVSTDDGLSFLHAGSGQPSSGLIGNTRIAVTPADPSIVYAHFADRNTNGTIGIYRSTDDASTWTARNTSVNVAGGQGWYNLSLAADPDDADHIITGGIRLYRSYNGGLLLTETGGGFGLGDSTRVHVDHHAACYAPGGPASVWVGSDGGIWRSTDDGENWVIRQNGLATYQFYDIGVAQSDPIFMMGGTQDNGIPGRSGPTQWFPTNLYADGMVVNVHPEMANVVYGEWQFGNHVKSLDGGQSWFPIMNGITGDGAWVAPVDLDRLNPSRLFTSTSQGIFRTESGGLQWENVHLLPARWISISPVDGDVVWALNYIAANLSLDGGDTWRQSSYWGFPQGGPTKVLAHPTDAGGAFVTYSGYSEPWAHVALTSDLGATWQDVTGDLPSQPVNAIAVDPDRTGDWYIGTDTGVWSSTDGGAHWLPFETGLPHAVVSDLEINRAARKLVAGTYGRGAWEIDLPSLTSTAETADTRSLRLMLDPPYPNPASGETTFRFAAREAAGAELGIYDVRGRLVERLASVRSDGVVRTLAWLPGEEVASGAYFAVLRSGEERVTRKLILSR